MNDILLKDFETPFQAFPFDKIKDTDFEPAVKLLLDQAKDDIQKIAENNESPSFKNTIEAMEQNGKQLNRVIEAFFNLHSADTNDLREELAQKFAPMLAAFSNDILLNEGLLKRVKAVYDASFEQMEDPEDKRLLEKTYKGFVRNGALLNEEQKTALRALDEQLAKLKMQFSQNVLQETNAYELHLTAEEDVAGLPDSILQQAAELAKSEGKEGYLFTLQFPSYVPFMKYAQNRERRKELSLAYGKRGFQKNDHNNEAIIKKIVQLKAQRAKVLGYATHADFVLEERMAKNPETVLEFLNDLLTKAKYFAQADVDALKPLAAADGISELMPWDHAYYAEKLREQKFDYSEEALKPYFPLQQVLDAAFGLAGKLFGLTFHKRNDIPVYHDEVTLYEVLENEKHKALLYTDFHPRAGKRPGAWMTSFKGQSQQEADRPHISIVCNFSRPTSDTPSLLTFQEVTTLFHEFGHALHGILANTRYESLSGTNVYWDFVELPSQFLENYCYEPAFLKTFAKHWKTGETLDDASIEKIVKAANFMEGYQTLRQLSFGLLDMAYHSGTMKEEESVLAFEQAQTETTRLYPKNDETLMSTSFSHIFGGGYDAGYYSYKWAEVLDADAFDYFKQNDIFNQSIAEKYKTLLSKGGTVDPMELYEAFRGKKPDAQALLKRAGLLNANSDKIKKKMVKI